MVGYLGADCVKTKKITATRLSIKYGQVLTLDVKQPQILAFRCMFIVAGAWVI
jgi:hypothetical protein